MILTISVFLLFFLSFIQATAMASSTAGSTAPSPIVIRSSQQSPSLLQDSTEPDMKNDASSHHVHASRPSPDVNIEKEKTNELTSTKLTSIDDQISDRNESITTNTEGTSSILPTTKSTSKVTKNEKLATSEEIPSSSLPSNQIMTTNEAQCRSDDNNENDALSFNHNIDSNATITAFHSISSDVNLTTQSFNPSSFDHQAHEYENDESFHPFPPPSMSSPSSSLMHEQPNHANEKYVEANITTDNHKSSHTRHNPDLPISSMSISAASQSMDRREGSFILIKLDIKIYL